MKTPKNEKECAILAWKTALRDIKPTPLLEAIGEAIRKAPRKEHTFVYAHELGKFSKKIADCPQDNYSNLACLDYRDAWTGCWHVSNLDLNVYSDFEMWFSRYAPENSRCETGSIARALHNKRMQQAYDRYKKTGLRKEHCELLKNMLWEIDTGRGDWISLHVQGKRPFGNSNIAYDIYEHCGWKMNWPEDDGMSRKQAEKAWDIFDELAFAAKDAAELALKNLE